MDKKNKKRYCIDEKLNRQVRRARLRTKTGIIIFLSVALMGAIAILMIIDRALFGKANRLLKIFIKKSLLVF